MKKVIKGVEPEKLRNYRQQNPTGLWDKKPGHKAFRSKKDRYIQVKDQLLTDQGGLCAYCEIDLRRAVQTGEKDDFRVEHFHPKADDTTSHNWNLDWNNLLGCCHGGSEKNVVYATSPNRPGRYTHTSSERSCDIPKSNHNWDGIICNPLTQPVSPVLFVFQRSSGSIGVHAQNCTTASVSPQKVKDSIDYLRLDSPRLQRLRSEALGKVNQLLQDKMLSGMTLDEARHDIARRMLRKNSSGHWPAFFSAIRGYLGQAAEEQLDSINYQG